VGTSALIPEFGGLVANAGTPMLNAPLPERVMKYRVTKDGVHFNDRIVLPFEPSIGTLGVSPQIEAVLSLQPDYWGGNMDLPDVAPGAVAYFPVQTKGAYLFLGDCHGRQGDGELKFRFHGQLIFSLNRRPCLPLNGAHVAQEQFSYR
jgi:acetamidase/formamidase